MARRVNTKFVTILLIAALVAGTAIWAAQTFLIRDQADVHVRRAQQDINDKPPKWDDAIVELHKASSLSPRDVNVQLLLGRVYANAAITDQSKIRDEKAAFDRVLEIDPNNLPALRALIQMCEDPNTGHSADLYTMAADYARRASRVAQAEIAAKEKKNPPEAPTPADLADLLHLQSLPAITAVQKSQLGLGTDQTELENAVTDLKALLEQNKKTFPLNAEIPSTLAQGIIQQALAIMARDDSHQHGKEIAALFDSAIAVFTDPNILPPDSGSATQAAATQPDEPTQDKNAEMHYRFARVLETVAMLDRSDPAKQKARIEMAQEQVDRARALVKEQDPLFMEINLFAADFYSRRGKVADSVRILRALPDTEGHQKNLYLGMFLGSDAQTRPEAIRTLSEGIDAMGGVDRMTAYTFKFVDLRTRLRIAEYGAAKDPAEQAQLRDQIESDIAKMKERRGNTADSVLIQKDQAQFLLTSQDFVKAIPILQALVSTNQNLAHDPAVLIMLGTAYDKAGQSSDAIEYFSRLVRQSPDKIEFRKPLVRMMLEHSPDQVEEQLAALEKLAPNDPEVIFDRIDVLTLDIPKNLDEIKKDLDRIPETSDTAIVQKSRREIFVHDWDNAARLLTILNKKFPNDTATAGQLAKVYVQMKQKDKALEILQTAIKNNPNSTDLKELYALVNGGTQADLEKIIAEGINNESDPVKQALERANQDNRRGDMAKLKEDLLEAEKRAPDSSAIWVELFQYYIHVRDFDQAQVYLDKIARADVDKVGGELYHFKLAQARQRKDQELEIARQLSKEKPEFAPVWLDLGEALQDNGQYESAIGQYTNALAKQADNLDAIRGIIQCDYALNRNDEALTTIKQGLAKIPDNAELRMLLLQHEFKFGDYDDAMAVVDSELKRQDDNPELWTAKGLLFMKGARQSEGALQPDQAKGRYKAAMDVLDAARLRWPNDAKINNAIVDLLIETRNFDQAETVLRQWSELDAWKDRPEPFQKMADFYDQTGHEELAENAMRVALSNSKYRIDLQLQMSELLVKHRKYQNALELLQAINSDNPSIKRAMIITLAAMQRFPEWQNDLEAALAEKSANKLDLLTLWAQLLLNKQDYPGASDKATQALAIDPRNPAASYIRASAHFFSKPPDYKAALDDLSNIRSLPDAKIHLMTADCYSKMGNIDEATSELRAALKAAPGSKAIRMKLVEIYSSGSRQRFSEAMSLLQDAENMPQYQTDPDIYKAEADLLSGHNDYTAAAEKSRKALELTSAKDAKAVDIVLHQYMDILLHDSPVKLLSETNAYVDADKSQWWFMLDRGLAKNAVQDAPGALTDLNVALTDAQSSTDEGANGIVVEAIANKINVDQAIAMVRPLAKDHLIARVSLALLLEESGKSEASVQEADGIMQDAAKYSPDDQFRAFSSLPRVYLSASPHPLVDKAIESYRAALKIKPDSVANLNDLACVLVDLSNPPQPKEALTYAEKAVDTLKDLGSSDANITETLAWVTIQNGDYNKGVDLLRWVIDQHPFPIAYLHLGEAYLKLNHPDDALAQANEGIRAVDKVKPLDTAMRVKLVDLQSRCKMAQNAKP